MSQRGRRGFGHLYRRGRTWWIKWSDANGRRHFRSSGSRDRGVAAAMLRDHVAQRDRGMPVLPDPRRVSVDMLLDGLLAEYRTNGRRSVGRAELSCAHLLRYFGGRSAAGVTGADITRYADLRLKEKAAPATVNRELAALRRAYRLAVRQGLLLLAPPITTLREDNVRTGFLDPDQVEAVCARLKRRDAEADIVRFCYQTGWRSRSEVFTLTWAQVDWAGGFVRLEPGTTKNREGRAFPITPALRAVLERRLDFTRRCERMQGRIIPWVFHRKGQPIRSMKGSWNRACEKAGVPGRLLHDLRRSAVRNLERAGVSRSVAMKMTGHKTESVYRRYAIVSESDLREAGAKLAAPRPAGDGLGAAR
jgi:integrase